MTLVLCDVGDIGALWAVGSLQERGVAVEVVTAPALDAAVRWDHRIGAAGASIEIELRDGRTLSNSAARGVLNRLTHVPTQRIDRIAGADRDYAAQELQALYLSWLFALPGPLVNPPTPLGLCGGFRHPSAWRALGRNAGLPVAAWRQSNEDDPAALWLNRFAPVIAYAIGGQVVAPAVVPDAMQAACLRLAAAAGAVLLGIEFASRPDGTLEMVGASPMPDLSRGGPRLADALAEVLAG